MAVTLVTLLNVSVYCIFVVIYFLFVMTLCVLSVTTTMCVMYLNSRADSVPVTAMPVSVCTCIYAK